MLRTLNKEALWEDRTGVPSPPSLFRQDVREVATRSPGEDHAEISLAPRATAGNPPTQLRLFHT